MASLGAPQLQHTWESQEHLFEELFLSLSDIKPLQTSAFLGILQLQRVWGSKGQLYGEQPFSPPPPPPGSVVGGTLGREGRLFKEPL